MRLLINAIMEADATVFDTTQTNVVRGDGERVAFWHDDDGPEGDTWGYLATSGEGAQRVPYAHVRKFIISWLA